MEQILKHPYLRDFYDTADFKVPQQPISVPVDDNTRLGLKDYRLLIYQEINRMNGTQPSPEACIYRIRDQPHRRGSKNRSLPTEQDEGPPSSIVDTLIAREALRKDSHQKK